MKIQFTKMHGLGNDFVVIDCINQSINLSTEQIRFIANRRLGIGCDQVLLVEKPISFEAEFRYRIFNSDGGEVQQCGNGARCFARFVFVQGLTSHTEIPVETSAGLIVLKLELNGEVTVNMGMPRFEPESLPFVADTEALSYELKTPSGVQVIAVASMGNPHAVLEVDDVDSAPVAQLGREIEHHPRFAQRVNVGFMQIISPEAIRLRVFERGTAETLACGTGACAAVAVGRHQGKLSETVKVSLPGGELVIRWHSDKEPLYMTGPASHVFEGTIIL